MRKWQKLWIKLAAFFLKWVEDLQDKDLYDAAARLMPSIAVEAVVWRRNHQQQVEVWMRLREPSESYAGQWHCPGSVLRPGEKIADTIARLFGARGELHGQIKAFNLVGEYFHQEERGWFLSKIVLVELDEEPVGDGGWWPVNALPPKTVSHHRNLLIPRAMTFIQSHSDRLL